MEKQLELAVEKIQRESELAPNPKRNEPKDLRDHFVKPIAGTLIDIAKEQYGNKMRKFTQKQLSHVL